MSKNNSLTNITKKSYHKVKVKNLKKAEKNQILIDPDTVPDAYTMNLVIEFNKSLEPLTVKRALFVKYFISDDLFGNATQAYLHAYYPEHIKGGIDTKSDKYVTAGTQGYNLLNTPNVMVAVENGLKLRGLNDTVVDSQLLYLIRQYGDNTAKIQAIKEYNRLHGKIVDRAQIHQVTEQKASYNLDILDEEELETFLHLLNKVTTQQSPK